MATATAQKRWRRKTRAMLLAAFGHFCSSCGANGSTPLEFAHRVPVRRATGPDGQPVLRRSDLTLRDVRAAPFGFILLCRPCHHANDGPSWRGFDR